MKHTDSGKMGWLFKYLKLLLMIISLGYGEHIQAAGIPCTTTTTSGTLIGINFELDHPTCICVGQTFTMVGRMTVTDPGTYSNTGFIWEQFAPGAGLGFTLSNPVGPFPVTNPPSTLDITDSGICGGAGTGTLTVPANTDLPPTPTLVAGQVYTFTFDAVASTPGTKNWLSHINISSNCFDLFTVTINVLPTADVSNVTYATACENSSVNNTLPSPSGTTGPIEFTVGNPVNGSVVLNNAASGTFTFTPNPDFVGTATFEYNVESTFAGQPPFCPDSVSGVATIPFIPTPIAIDATFNACAGTGLTGSLVPFVTGGGGGPYNFTITSGNCPNLVVDFDGSFTFTPPNTGTCNFVYLAQENNPPICFATANLIFNVQQIPTADDQTLNTCINQPVSGTLTGSAVAPATVVSFAIASPPAQGTAVITNPSTGDFTYTPTNPLFVGTDSFTFTVTDSNGCVSAPGTVTINVNPQPIVSSTAVGACLNTTLTGDLQLFVTGGSGPISFGLVGPQPTCGSVAIDPSGPFSFVPNPFTTGTCSFQFSVNEGGCAGTGTVTVTIQNAPVTVNSTTGVCASGTVSDDLNNYVITAPGVRTFTGGPGVNGTLSLNSNGMFTFTPSITSGNANFMWQVFSSQLPCPSAPATYTIIVNPPPTILTGQAAVCGTAPTNGSLLPNVPGELPPLTFTGPGVVVNGTVVISSNGNFTFTADPGVTGGSFTFGVTNGNGCSATGTQLVVVNPTPSATGFTTTGCSNTGIRGTVTGQVGGGTPPFIFSQVGISSGGTVVVNPNGTFTFTPAPGSTSGSFTFRVTDSNGCTATAVVNIVINAAPVGMTGFFTGCNNSVFTGSLVPLVTGTNPPFTFSGPFGQAGGTASVGPNGDFSFSPTIASGQGSFNFNATDSNVPPCTTNLIPVIITIEPGPQALTANFTGCVDTPFASGLTNFVSGGLPPYTFTGGGLTPACGTFVLMPNGQFTFTPTPGFSGPCSFIFQVTDSTPCTSNQAPATVFVSPNPVASSPLPPLEACAGNPFTGNLNDFTTDGVPPYSFTGGNEINGSLDLSPSGPFAFTPVIPGAASFDYSAIDSVGCQSNTGTVSFAVSASPIVISPSPIDTCQNTPVSSTFQAVGGNPPYLTLAMGGAVIVSTTNGTAVIDTFNNITGTGTFTFTPDPGLVFVTPTIIGSVTIRVTDSNPTTGGCFGEVTVIVNIHQNPIVSDTGIVACTGDITGSLAPLVTGAIPPFFFELVGPISPTGCAIVTIAPNGDFTFDSPPGFSGPCSFEFQVTESSTGACSNTGTVIVNVDIPPVVMDGIFCVCANAPFTGSLASLIVTGTGPFTFSILGAACVNLGPQFVRCTVPGGTVFLNTQTGTFTFAPDAGFLGLVTFSFQVTDALGCVSNIGMVTINVPCCPFVPTGVTAPV